MKLSFKDGRQGKIHIYVDDVYTLTVDDTFWFSEKWHKVNEINDEELAALGKACESFEKAVSTGDPKKIAQADVEFHNIIVKAAGNTRLVQLINNLSEQMYRYRFEYIKDVSTHEQLIAEHRILFDCIRNKDKATAAKTAKLHIDNQENAIMRQLHKEQEKNAAHA